MGYPSTQVHQGTVTFRATTTDGVPMSTTRDMTIRIPGLVHTVPGPHYVLIGSPQPEHHDGHFGTQAVNNFLEKIALDYINNHPATPGHPTPNIFKYNDQSRIVNF